MCIYTHTHIKYSFLSLGEKIYINKRKNRKHKTCVHLPYSMEFGRVDEDHLLCPVYSHNVVKQLESSVRRKWGLDGGFQWDVPNVSVDKG